MDASDQTMAMESIIQSEEPKLYSLVLPQIDQTPDLRCFQSPAAIASLKKWTPSLIWSYLVEELTALKQSPEEADRVVYDLLVDLAIKIDEHLADELIEYYQDHLYTFFSSYPMLTYFLLIKPQLHPLVVMGDHPNLRIILQNVINDSIDKKSLRFEHYLPRRPYINRENVWDRFLLSHFVRTQETADWLLQGVSPSLFPLLKTTENFYVVKTLWKTRNVADDKEKQAILQAACRASVAEILIGEIAAAVPIDDGDYFNRSPTYLLVQDAVHLFKDVNALEQLLNSISGSPQLGEAAWEGLSSRLDDETLDNLHPFFSTVQKIFPFKQHYRGKMKGWHMMIRYGLDEENLDLIDAMLEAGLHEDYDEDEGHVNPLSYALHSCSLTTFRHIVKKYAYDPTELLYDAMCDPFANEHTDALEWILKHHSYDRETLLQALYCGDGNYAKTQVVLDVLNVKQPKWILGASYRLKEHKDGPISVSTEKNPL